jgi:glycosyltransferase involved in cell wall biosynthesis
MTKLLMIAPFCHVPPLDGASQRATHLLEGLAKEFAIHLLAYRKHDADQLQTWAEERGIGLNWLPAQPAPRHGNIAQRLASPLPPGFASHSAQEIGNSISASILELGPFDVLYFATQMMGQALLPHRFQIPAVTDCYDVYTPIARQRISETPFYRPYHWVFRWEALKTLRYEQRIFRLSRLVFAVSDDDQASVQRIYPQASTTVIPNGIDLPVIRPVTGRSPEVLMVANYSYTPNAEGFRWLYQQVWPRVRQLFPQARLRLAGKDSQPLQTLTSGDDSVEWLGFVPDLGVLYQRAACAVVPILTGGGTRLKTLEAMAWQIPLVVTRLGASGIQHADTITVRDDPGAFAQAVVERLTNPAAFQDQAARARQVVSEKYAWDGICRKACQEIQKMVEDEQGS